MYLVGAAASGSCPTYYVQPAQLLCSTSVGRQREAAFWESVGCTLGSLCSQMPTTVLATAKLAT